MVPIDKQLELLLELKPEVKTVGVIFNNSEPNSEAQVEALKYNVPILGAEESIVGKGGLLSIGIDYFRLGKETAYKVVKILEGKKHKILKLQL